jgi:hypothetical protein
MVNSIVDRLIEITKCDRAATHDLLDWLKIEHDIDKPSLKLQSLADLDSDAFIAEAKRLRGKKKPLTSAALKSLRDEFDRSVKPAQKLFAEAMTLEQRISDLVNEAYGLTAPEIDLMWKTAPPRMPIPRRVTGA